MTTYTQPAPFPGTTDEVAANRNSHTYIYTGTDEDMDVRCTGCDCRPSYISAEWPCGATVPRITIER